MAAAVEEFARSGFDAASTNRIAASAGVSKGLVFRHFGSKEGLLEAALAHSCERVCAAEMTPLPRDPFLRLEEFLVRRASVLAQHPWHARVVAQFRGRRYSVMSAPARRIDEAYARLRKALREDADKSVFRSGVDPRLALDLLVLVADAFEGQLLDALRALSAAGAGDRDLPAGAGAEVVRQRAQGLVELLRGGIYRPGVTVEAQPVPLNPEDFIALSRQLAPVERAADQRRDRVLRCAQEMFVEYGYDGVSIEAIAAKAGVAKGLVFHHFGSKPGLYLAAVGDAIERVSAMFFEQEAATEPELFQRLLTWTRRKMCIFQQEPILYRLVLGAFSDPPPPVREAVARYMTEGTHRGWALILEGIDTTPLRPGVQLDLAVELVTLVVNAMADRMMADLANEPDQGLGRLPHIVDQTAAYLTLLRDGLG